MALTRTVSDYKDSVRVATTGANINLAAAPNTLDGVSLVLNDRVLVKDQTPSALNGIYRVTTLGTGSNGSWTRASDFNDYRQISSGALTFVEQGAINGNIFYYIPGGEPNVQIGTTAITFANLYSFIDNTVSQNLQSVTSYGNTTTNGITISNATAATSTTTGALIVSGGVGIGGNLYVSGNLSVAGNTTFINTTTITTSDTIAAPSIFAGTIGNTGANLVGLVNTNSQPYIISVGTLTGLASIGNITAQTANVYADNIIGNTAVYSSAYYWSNGATFAQTVTGTYSNSNVAAYLTTYTGTLSPNSLTTSNGGQITGYLNGAIGANVANTGAFTSISATSTIIAQGTISSPTINAGTIGNSGALLYGTLNSSSASQPNITSVGTLTSLTSSGTIAAPTVIGAIIGNSGAQFYGTLNSQSSNQPNISSVGTLTSLTTSGNIAAQTANVYASNLIGNTAIYGTAFYFANGTPFTSSSYGNTQVAAYLPTYSGNLSAGNATLTGAVQANTHTGVAVYAGTIGNSGATFSGASGTLTGLFTASNLDLSLTTASTVTAVLTRGSDPNFQLTAQNGPASNATGAETARFGINYSGTGWDSFIQFIRGSSSQNGSLALWAANTAVANVASTSIYPVSNNAITLGTASGQYFSATYANNYYGTNFNGSSIFGTIIGNTASAINGNIHTGSAVYAGTIGNTGTTLTGTLSTAAQTNITSVGTLTGLTVTATITGSVSGNAGTATALQTARNINGVSFNGTADITVHTAGTGISVSGTTITNTGVTSAVAGTGISVNSTTGAVTITNTGVTSAVAGTGISVSGATGAVTITNNGVTSAVAGTGVSVSGSTGAVTFSIGQAVGTGNSPTFAGLTVNSGLTAVAQSFNSNPASIDAGRIFAIYNTNYMPGASYSSGDSRIMDFGVTTGNIAYMRHAGSNGLQWYVGGNGTSFNNALLPTSNASINIGGTGSNYWSTVYAVSFVGTSTTAKYADLAEMYHADNYYSPGTVMIFGGDLDVTVSTQSHDTAVAGVVSTNPAYLMNDNFENDNWLPIALTGRVPCLVRGPVNKGTLLVSSNESGVACALDKSLYEPGCVIGKSMDIILDNSVRKIEIAVGRF